MKFNNYDVALIFETVLHMAEQGNNLSLLKEDVNSYPLQHTSDAGRNLDYGKEKSSSHEGRMTKAKLFRMAQMAQRLHDKLVDADDLPEWVQDKVTTAEDRLRSAHDYISYKIWRLENGQV
jgi:hypothetical protein